MTIEVVIQHKVVAHADHVRIVSIARTLKGSAVMYGDDDFRVERTTNEGSEVYSANFIDLAGALQRFEIES